MKLWKTVVCGSGETDLSWANPASIIPLRVHAFGSLLQLLGSVSLFMAKNGVTQIDGSGKWDLITLGRIVALLFDEEKLFGKQEEVIGDADLIFKPAGKVKGENPRRRDADKSEAVSSKDKFATADVSQEKPQRRRRHQRNTFELFNHSVDALDKTSGFGDLLAGLSSDDNDLQKRSQTIAAPSSTKSTGTSEISSTSTTSSSSRRENRPVDPLGIDTSPVSDYAFSSLHPPSSSNSNVKVDSVSDFRSNLEIGLQNETSDDSFDKPLTAGNVQSLMQKFGGLSNSTGKKRWMTAPAPALATIRESEDDDSDALADDFSNLPLPHSSSLEGPKDELDSEIHRPDRKTSVRQMRVPKVRGKAAPAKKDADPLSEISATFSASSRENADLSKPNPVENTLDTLAQTNSTVIPVSSIGVPKSDEEIERAGNDFLASIGSSFGLRYAHKLVTLHSSVGKYTIQSILTIFSYFSWLVIRMTVKTRGPAVLIIERLGRAVASIGITSVTRRHLIGNLAWIRSLLWWRKILMSTMRRCRRLP